AQARLGFGDTLVGMVRQLRVRAPDALAEAPRASCREALRLATADRLREAERLLVVALGVGQERGVERGGEPGPTPPVQPGTRRGQPFTRGAPVAEARE